MKTSYMIPVNLTEASSTDWSYTGIYKITNKISGKCYIGQAVDIRSRLMNHVLQSKNKKTVLYKAINKYGIENFDCRVLIIINTFGKTQDEIKKELNYHECFYVDLYNSYNNGYNMTLGGDSVRLGFKHTKETIEKIKKAHKNYKPRRAFDVSKKTYGYDLLTQTIIDGESIAEISHKTGVNHRSIGHICMNNNYKNGGRFIANKRWLFSFSKEDLVERVNFYISGEYQISLHNRYCKYWEERRRLKNGGL